MLSTQTGCPRPSACGGAERLDSLAGRPRSGMTVGHIDMLGSRHFTPEDASQPVDFDRTVDEALKAFAIDTGG